MIMTTLSQKALEIAIGQIGNEEHPRGSNWGEPVKTYLKSVSITFPAAWCMAFVYWCFNEAAKQEKVVNPMHKTGGVLAQYKYRKAKAVTVPEPGDVFIMDYGGGLGHTGIVEKVNTDGTLLTIEGNTNDTGSREGYEVCRRVRPLGKIKAFLRF
jgi:hypothetical protein